MQQTIDLEVSLREERGKNAARRLRVNGKLPGTLYGLEQDAIAIAVDTTAIAKILRSPSGHNQILNVTILNGEKAAGVAGIAKDWQIDPVRGVLLHVDILRLDLSQKMVVTVPVAIIGPARGVKEQGGFEEVVTREIEIECLPLEVPDKIEVDVTPLMIGQSVRVRDLPANDRYTFRTAMDRVLIHVVAPRAEEEAATVEAAAAPAEPEVIEKGKTADKGEAAEGKEGKQGKKEKD